MNRLKIFLAVAVTVLFISCKDSTKTTAEGSTMDQNSGYTEEELDNRGGQSQTDAPDTSATQTDRTEEGSVETK